MRKKGVQFALITLLSMGGAIGIARAENETATPPLQLSGFWSIESGQMNNFGFLQNQLLHQDLLRTYFNFGITKQLTPNLQIKAFAEGKMYYNTFDKQYIFGVESFVLPTMYYSFYFDQMDAIYTFGGDTTAPLLQLTLGYFPFKYNPDVRDLGEYLYRSGTYPACLYNNFDFAKARLAGLKATCNVGIVHQDLLLTMETDNPSFFDLNAGYVVSFDFGKTLQLGAGAMYRSLVPANTDLTSPKDFSNNGYWKNGVVGDTGYYTYAGLKLMGRLSFDPKRLFSSSEDDFGIFGKEDFKIYGEGAILGVENYPAATGLTSNPYGYDTLKHKIPVMFGFDIPAFKVLDVFAAEFEWYGCTYPNNNEFKGEQQPYPDPITPTVGTSKLPDYNYSHSDNWKWAFYAKRSFKCGAYLVGQVARDHIRNETPIASTVDREEALRTVKAWFWVLKAGFRF
jgi:hypothetical protein